MSGLTRNQASLLVVMRRMKSLHYNRNTGRFVIVLAIKRYSKTEEGVTASAKALWRKGYIEPINLNIGNDVCEFRLTEKGMTP